MSLTVYCASASSELMEFEVLLSEDDGEIRTTVQITSEGDCTVENPTLVQRMGISIADVLAMARFASETEFPKPKPLLVR